MQDKSYLLLSIASCAFMASFWFVSFEETSGQETLYALQKSFVLEEEAQNYHMISGKIFDSRMICASLYCLRFDTIFRENEQTPHNVLLRTLKYEKTVTGKN